MVIKTKWRFAIGTTSRVPDSKDKLHYLIADFDTDVPNLRFITSMDIKNLIMQRTEHGWHLYTDFQLELDTLVSVLKNLVHADPAWIRIGEKRGYFFLADKAQIVFPWPVEHMVIHYGKKKT